jgi:hypothetical protein
MPDRDVDGPKTQGGVEFSAHQQRGVEEVERMRRRAPSRVANVSRNAQAGVGRHRRWEPARDSLWDFLAPHLDEGASVAVVGAGNCDDLPLKRIAERAAEVTLIDLDPVASKSARRRLGRKEGRKVGVIGHDVTEGAADDIVRSALSPTGGNAPDDDPARQVHPLPGAPYDLLIGDLFYSQLLYPALLDLEVDPTIRDEVLAEHAPPLTRAVVARLQASASRVVHVHDPIAWWDGHEQPVTLEEILTAYDTEGPDDALALSAQGNGPHESDPRTALADLGLTPTATALWHWPFTDGVDYLACATLIDSER